MSEYLRMSGIYWGITAMAMMKKLELMNKSAILEFVDSCLHPCGGYSASVDHDPHLLYTLSAIQVRNQCILFLFFVFHVFLCIIFLVVCAFV